MLILVINAGSSSLKYQLINMDNETVIARGNCERIGIDGRIIHKVEGSSQTFDIALPNHSKALSQVIKILTTGDTAVITDISDITAVGHRTLVDDTMRGTVIVGDEEIKHIESTMNIAPLHTPGMIAGIKACWEIMGKEIVQVAVFDTSFHNTMPQKASVFSIPYKYFSEYGIRRFGYHGTSHKFVSMRLAKLLGRNYKDLKIITCHLGNGSSICAVDKGESIDTSMGYTPLDGLTMGTRCGSIDPAIILHIADIEGKSLEEVTDMLNKKSGLLGISGISSDDRDISKAASEGNERARLAQNIVRYQIKKYIGSYMAAMGGLDAIVFTGGIGEKSEDLRRDVCEKLECFGIKFDNEKNVKQNGKEAEISADDSRVKVWIIPTNEELMIARETLEQYKKAKSL